MTIAFNDLTQVTVIVLSQLPSSLASAIPFIQFQVSFSVDHGLSYSYLPPALTSTLLGETFNYTIPTGVISCNYLRIHILDVNNRAALANSVTGLSIVEIYGQPPSSYSACKSCRIHFAKIFD